jgi:DNA-binding FadR family transcriptional regulator
MKSGAERVASRGRPARLRGFRVPKTSEVIARWMRKQISDQRLSPGDALPSETALREEFEVSRPTVREALRILEAQQLVRIARGATGGARYSLPGIGMVAEHTGIYLEAHHATQMDLTEARLNIEPRVVGFIAERAEADLGPLKASVEAHREVMGDLMAFSREHEHFYALLADLCPNKTLGMFLQIVREIMTAQTDLMQDEIVARGQTQESMEAHVRAKEKLVGLIEAHDRAGAEDLWRRHLDAQLRLLVETGRGDVRLKTS